MGYALEVVVVIGVYAVIVCSAEVVAVNDDGVQRHLGSASCSIIKIEVVIFCQGLRINAFYP